MRRLDLICRAGSAVQQAGAGGWTEGFIFMLCYTRYWSNVAEGRIMNTGLISSLYPRQFH